MRCTRGRRVVLAPSSARARRRRSSPMLFRDRRPPTPNSEAGESQHCKQRSARCFPASFGATAGVDLASLCCSPSKRKVDLGSNQETTGLTFELHWKGIFLELGAWCEATVLSPRCQSIHATSALPAS